MDAGVPSFLLDVVPPDADGEARNRVARAGLDAVRKSKPAIFPTGARKSGYYRQLRRPP